MDQEMAKSLVNLIDETISEIEDLKKSRYSAAEAKIGDDDSGMAGAKKDGSMGKADDDKDDDKDKDKKDDEAAKAEGKNSEADPGTRGVTDPDMCDDPGKSNLHAEAAKAEDDSDDDDDDKKKKDDMDKAEGKNSEADPGKHGDGKVRDKGADAGKSNLESEAKKSDDAAKAEQPAEGYDIKKSLEEQESLFKGYVDEKVGSLEKKLEAILDVVKEMGDEPAERKGVPAGKFVPLKKSEDDGAEPLSKSAALDKLFELKKSGTHVDSADIASVEMGGDLQAIVEKYSLN